MPDTNFLQIETEVVKVLKNTYDPEIPVNVYDLGLIYRIDVDESNFVNLTMTLTAPNCPMADELVFEIKDKLETIPGVTGAAVDLTFNPPWDKSLMSEEALLELGLL
jgi:FeS assembly SUF system protein